MKAADLTGRTFDRLKVISRAERPPYYTYTGAWWLCECECGATVIVRARDLVNRGRKSCGCLRRDMAAEKAHQINERKRSNT